MAKTEDAISLETLKLCIKLKDLAWGKHVHAYMVTTKIMIPVFFLNIITDMYGKCGSLEDARAVFEGMHKQNVVSWNVMISSYARHGLPEVAIELFRQMESMGLPPDNVTFVGLLDACATIGDLRLGAQAHIYMSFSKLQVVSVTTNALINMYSKCGSMDLASEVFNKLDDQNVASWNTILSGYCLHRDTSKVLEVFEKMNQNVVTPDKVSYLIVLNACALLGDKDLAKDVHARIKQAGIKSDLVLENALLDMYTKCGSANIALQIFSQMLVRNVISWTVVIASHSNRGDIDEAFFLFHQMQCEGVSANDVTILGILCVCSSFGELQKGKQIHTSIVGSALEEVVHVGNAVVDMYSKCGSLVDASKCFHKMRARDRITWNSIVSSHAKHGHGKEVLKLVQEMREEGFKLDSVTLASVLSACSRAGLIIEAFSCLKSIEEDNGLVPNSSHFACVVDLLARAGLLETADSIFNHIPDEPNLASWRTLLGACKVHDDSERAKSVANAMLTSQSSKAQVVETISNMHFFLASIPPW